tara:strand:+ start:3810 stop:4007 length:198 start_codon:yes stop_codon:yes gene_type:complete
MKKLKFQSVPVKLSELKAGDLFHSVDHQYLDDNPENGIGIKVFVRSNIPMTKKQRDEYLYKILIK